MARAIASKRSVLWGAPLVMATAAASLGLAAGSAAADSPQPAGGRHCAVLIGKATAGQDSPVLGRACDDTSATRARAKMLKAAQNTKSATVAPLASTPLMVWYAGAGYGSPYTTIYGAYGTCDSAGYRLTPSSWWATNMSSASGLGACNIARFANRAGTYSATYWLPVSYIGSALNDNVGRVWVYHR